MRLGFVILAHTDLHRVAALIRHLVQENCVVAVHIDKKVSDDQFENLKLDIGALESVVFAKRVHCEWGKFSLVQATLDASQKLLSEFPEVSNVLLISGSCLPIRPIRQLKLFLKRNGKTDYIESVSVNDNYWVKDGLNEERFSLYFPVAWRKHRKIFDGFVNLQRKLKIQRKIPKPLIPHIGSQWWCLTSKTLKAIIEDPKRPVYDRYFKFTWIPDESYFQTLARLHSKSIESRSLTFSKFDYKGRPFVLYDDHIKELSQSDCFMARKIWSGADVLFDTLLDPTRANQPMSRANPAAFSAKFDAADAARCSGGEGRFHQSRFPHDWAERSGVSASEYSVFIGHEKIYPDFQDWLGKTTNALTYGNVFACDQVANYKPSDHLPGNLPSDPKIRNRNPKAYLSNFLWPNRDRHQCLMYDIDDTRHILRVLANDPKAHVLMVRHAWLLTLLKDETKGFASILKTAKRFHELEEHLVLKFSTNETRANFQNIALHDALEAPAQFLEQSIGHIPSARASGLKTVPEHIDVAGLDKLVRRLRNNGLRIDYETYTRNEKKKKQETVYEKLYVVR